MRKSWMIDTQQAKAGTGFHSTYGVLWVFMIGGSLQVVELLLVDSRIAHGHGIGNHWRWQVLYNDLGINANW